MGKALADNFAEARAVFAEVDEALGQSLSKLMWEGPSEELTLTANAQPALMAVSLATLRVLEAKAGLDLKRHVAFVAGHSLGEYSALAAAGEPGRGRHGAPAQAARRRHAEGCSGRCRRHGGAARPRARRRQGRRGGGRARPGLRPANDNGGGQVVISGRQGGGRASATAGPGQGRQARHDAAGLGALPLRAHATGRRGDARSARGRRHQGSRRAARRQRARSGRSAIPAAIRDGLVAAGYRPPCAGANPSPSWRPRALIHFMRSEPARC